MKKYLMTGMAALAICAAFTSCSKETNVYNPDQPKQDIQLTYEQAFIKAIGQPAADQDWGFGTAAKTRTAINVNGNEEKYEDAPSLKENEETEIRDYVRQLGAIPQVAPTGLKNYFVKQVHCGEEYYTNADGGAGILGSSKMNRLMILMQEDGTINDGALSAEGQVWMHINNFNRADNTDWNGNTLVEDGATYNFAYHGTEDSKYHDRWISVKGEDVDKYYNDLGTYQGAKYAGFYYICFDFEATIGGPTRIANITYKDPVTGQWANSSTIDIPGIYSKEDIESLSVDLDVAIPAEQHWDSSIGEYGAYVVDRWVYVNLSNPDQVKSINFSNVLDGNRFIEGNNKYDDWIVRLVEATPKDPNPDPVPNYTIGVIGEDLTSAEEGDFDFNDVVFNVALNVPGKTYIKLRAAGGTLPLIIGIANPDDNEDYTANEVHNLFGGYSTKTMINTGASAYGASADGVPEKEFVLNQEYSNAKFIPVYVKKNGQWVELTAKRGTPASKIGVAPDFRIVPEQVFIGSEGQYPLFTKWVTENTDDVSNWQGVVSEN